MPQNARVDLVIAPVNLPQVKGSALGIAVVKGPGGPVVFTNHGTIVVPALAGATVFIR